MDQSNRRKVSGSSPKRISLRKSALELNGNNQNQTSHKFEGYRRQKQQRDCYKSSEEKHVVEEMVPNYVPLHGQRLFAAVSDPAVCGYPVSLAYPYDPLPVPLGYPLYQTSPYHSHRMSYKESVGQRSPKISRVRRSRDKIEPAKDTFETVDEYTSLPPGNLQDIESDHQRRFSDPGLANNSGSEEQDSLSNGESSASWFADSQVSSQIEALVQENKRLSKELKETQAELQELKLEVVSLSQVQSSCEPGFISDLVREVHEATKLREETFLARINAFSENQGQIITSSGDIRKECTRECEVIKEQLSKANSERDKLSRRLSILEEQMKMILTHNSGTNKHKVEQLENEKEKQQLKEELKTAKDANTSAEASIAKYEWLLNTVKKRLPNGLVLEGKQGPVSTPSETSESLSSSLGSGSLTTHSPQPQVTMSGPVTDL